MGYTRILYFALYLLHCVSEISNFFFCVLNQIYPAYTSFSFIFMKVSPVYNVYVGDFDSIYMV